MVSIKCLLLVVLSFYTFQFNSTKGLPISFRSLELPDHVKKFRFFLDIKSVIAFALWQDSESVLKFIWVSGNHSFSSGINFPSNIFYILNLLHRAIHDVKTECTSSTDNSQHHDLKIMVLTVVAWRFMQYSPVDFFLFSEPNKLKLIQHYFDVRLVGETNLKNNEISLQGSNEFKYV